VSSRPFAVITGGGTGGHVSPAIAVAQALVACGHEQSEIVFVGGRPGIEGRLVPEAGYVLHRLPGHGIARRLTRDNLAAVGGLGLACVMAIGMALRRRPRVVISVGGYAGFAYGLAAIVLRIPLLVVTVDAVPGAVNRILGRFAQRNAVAFPETALARAVVTGPPVRTEVLSVSRSDDVRAAVRARLGIEPGRRLLVATGGSLGAASVNRAVVSLAAAWSDRSDIAIYHLGGHRNSDVARAAAAEAGLVAGEGALQYCFCEYDPALVEALAACDLAICRAGATTVAELTAIGVPSILVPLPGAPSDHQTRNAAALAHAGAALMIADRDLDGERLATAVSECLETPGRLDEMSAAAQSLGHRDAAERVAQLAVALSERRAGRSRRLGRSGSPGRSGRTGRSGSPGRSGRMGR
jgi:undecaprenyldiphospho-muramoylpentapeptide beta-N-acetylglucosaminyltransferase